MTRCSRCRSSGPSRSRPRRPSRATREDAPEVAEQYVFTITDGGFAKRTRINDYRTQSRGGLGIKAMSLANEDRGGLVGAFIVVEGDEILSITSGGQVVRSPIDENFRATGRSTMGVRFVTPKNGDSVAVVARSVEQDAAVEEAVEEAIEEAEATRNPRTRVQQSASRKPRPDEPTSETAGA